MIRICYIIGELTKGGAERQLLELVIRLRKDVYDPVVVSLTKGGYWSGRLRRLGVKVVHLERRGNKDLKRFFSLIRTLRELQPQIVHTFLFDANCYGRIAAFMTRVPVIIATERNFPELGKKKTILELSIDKFLALFSDAIICNSLKAAELLVEKHSFNPTKIFKIHNGINSKDFFCENGRNDQAMRKRVVIGTIGSLTRQKNHKLYLDMAHMLLQHFRDKDIRFIIVGRGHLEQEMRDYAQTLEIDQFVRFAGERHDIPEILRDMHVFVLTSRYEGLSNAIMEAMAAGLPVVATDVGGNSELVSDGETGFLCPPSDAGKLADKVHYLLANKNKAKQMGVRGRERILRYFGVEKMVHSTEQLYEKFVPTQAN